MLRHAAGGWATAVGAHHGGRAPPRGTGQLIAQRARAVAAFVRVEADGLPHVAAGYASSSWLYHQTCKIVYASR